MALFDSNKKEYLTFYIHLTDPAAVAANQALYPDGVNRAPYNPGPPPGGAAVEFNAPWRGYKEPAAAEAPFSWTPWNGAGEQDGPYPINVATFTRRTGGFLGIGGTTIRYYWMGAFVLAADPDGDPGVNPEDEADIPERLWLEGFEAPGLPDGIGGTALDPGMHASPDASRHAGGLGLAMRSATTQITYSAASTPRTWERFYIRLRRLPSVATGFWQCGGSSAALEGAALGITSTGQLALYTVSIVGVFTLLSTVDIGLEEWTEQADHQAWKRLDLLIGFPDDLIRLYVNGAPVATFDLLNVQAGHGNSKMGNGGANDLELDIDDWMCSHLPTRDGIEQLNGKDFLNGSKVALLKPSGYTVNHAAASWDGDYRVLAQNPAGTAVGVFLEKLASSTASALISVHTDDETKIDADSGSIGVASMKVHVLSKKGSTATGQLGYSIAGGAPVMAGITESSSSRTARAVMYSAATSTPAGPTAPVFPPVSPVELRYTKGADTGAAEVYALVASVELIGKFGPEDFTATELAGITEPVQTSSGAHNYPYPQSPWAHRGLAPPISPYIVWGGTYVGNGVAQNILFRSPVHWLYVHPVGEGAGYFFLSPMLGAHKNFTVQITPQIADIGEDLTFGAGAGEDTQQQQYRIRLVGDDAQINAPATTYQYIAVSDPGMRYMLNGALVLRGTSAGLPRTRVLDNELYTPGFAFVFPEEVTNSVNVGLHVKSGGNAAAAMVQVNNGGVNTDALTFGDGEIIFGAGLTALNRHIAYSLWRKNDGNQDTGESRVVNFGSYVGDGNASRTITLAPESTRRPLFALVSGEGTQAILRDPSNVGTESREVDGDLNTATGITGGGVDQFTVGIALNATDVVYSYFVLYAIADCEGNGGWGCNGEVPPVEPTSPQPGPFPPPPPEPTNPGGGGGPTPGTPGFPGGPPGGGGPDFSTACKAWSTYVINVALSKIGASKQIDDITTDLSEEAYKARLVYAMDVEQVLRDFPWPFATRYADLVLVGGTPTVPVNRDWHYSYRAPADFIHARRIVGMDGQRRAYDGMPPTFKIGSDATGILIYTNEAATATRPVHLEYTIRMSCPAQQGDPLFRAALVWKHASSLALTIAKDQKRAEECEVMYRDVLRDAKVVAAGEQQHDLNTGDADWISGR